MLAWLLDLFPFLRRNERCLFRYWDGVKNRSIDPVATYRKLWTSDDCRLMEDAATARNPLKEDGAALYPITDVYEAEDRLRTMTRQIFGVKEWQEGQPGLTVDETDELLNRFMEFCADLKKKRNPSPIVSAPSTSPEPAPSMDTDDCPVGPPPDCSSSPIASTAAAPTGP